MTTLATGQKFTTLLSIIFLVLCSIWFICILCFRLNTDKGKKNKERNREIKNEKKYIEQATEVKKSDLIEISKYNFTESDD